MVVMAAIDRAKIYDWIDGMALSSRLMYHVYHQDIVKAKK
jgi:hypothetical protein